MGSKCQLVQKAFTARRRVWSEPKAPLSMDYSGKDSGTWNKTEARYRHQAARAKEHPG